MKNLILVLAAGLGALFLTACQSTSNSSDQTAVRCSVNAYGQSVNQYGQPCNTTANSCANAIYNPSTGQWVNSAGVPVYCNNNTGLPYGQQYGYGGTGYGTGCQYWSSVYPGTQYVPAVDPSSGQLVCLNMSSYGVAVPQWYDYSYPVYISGCPYGGYSCGGQQWGYSGPNYGYSGGSGVCLGFGVGDFFGGACF